MGSFRPGWRNTRVAKVEKWWIFEQTVGTTGKPTEYLPAHRDQTRYPREVSRPAYTLSNQGDEKLRGAEVTYFVWESLGV